MRLTAPEDSLRGPVLKYLLPDERLVIILRQHPARLLPALTLAVGGLLAAVAVNGIAGTVRPAQPVVWVLAAFLLIRAVVDVLTWAVQYIVVTERRLVLSSGLLGRKVTVIPMTALQNLAFTRSAGGRILGYGAFAIEGDGQGRAVIDYIPYPEQIYLEIYRLLYPDDGDDGGYGEYPGHGQEGGGADGGGGAGPGTFGLNFR